MPAMSNGDLMYGFEAFFSGIMIGLLYTIELFWFIPSQDADKICLP